LSHAARQPDHDQSWFARWIADPGPVNPEAEMPAFDGKLSPRELAAISAYLAGRT
jgi:mono/diheme cytochrome c family protein